MEQCVVEGGMDVLRGEGEHGGQRFGGEKDAVPLIPPEGLPGKAQHAQ